MPPPTNTKAYKNVWFTIGCRTRMISISVRSRSLAILIPMAYFSLCIYLICDESNPAACTNHGGRDYSCPHPPGTFKAISQSNLRIAQEAHIIDKHIYFALQNVKIVMTSWCNLSHDCLSPRHIQFKTV